MIKIIKPGTRKNTECDTCGCMFLYEKEDIQNEEIMYGDNMVIKDYLTCPQCHERIDLNSNEYKFL